MISMEIVANFYALSENYGSPEDDYLILYEQGRLTQEAKTIYQAILEQGPLDTIALRKAARMSSRESESRFNKAVADLQADFKLVPTSVTQAGAWRYAFAYDIPARYYPEILEKARFIGELDARRTLVLTYLRSVGASQIRDIALLFGWRKPIIQDALEKLVQEGSLRKDIEIENQPGEWFAASELLG